MAAPIEWTVVTWNVHGSERPRVAQLATVLRATAPDVIALQEVRWWQAHRLGWALGMRVKWRLKHYPFTRFVFFFAEGAAILTAHDCSTEGVEVISAPFPTTTYRRRIAQWALIRHARGQLLRVVNAHLSPEMLSDDRREEAHRLAAMVERWGEGVPCVVAGDLNDNDEPEIIDIIPGTEFERPEPTNPAAAPTQVLDHVLLPETARYIDTVVPPAGDRWAGCSDHLPVTVRFTL